MPLKIQVKTGIGGATGGTVTIELAGSLDTATSPELERGLMPLLEKKPRDLVFDLAGLDFVSSAGLRVLGIARKHMKEYGGHVSFLHMQPQIKEVFEIIKALPGLSVFKDVGEFDAYITARQRRDRDADSDD
jgi:anti-anti-sigma factor